MVTAVYVGPVREFAGHKALLQHTGARVERPNGSFAHIVKVQFNDVNHRFAYDWHYFMAADWLILPLGKDYNWRKA